MNCHRPFRAVAIVLFVSLSPQHAEAGVTFEFTYFDSPGVGFNAGALGEARKDSLESVAAKLGSLIAQDATVQIGIVPSEFDGTGALATAGADFEGLGPPTAGFFSGEVQAEIIDGVGAAGSASCGGLPCHGGMVVDLGYSYALSGDPGPTEHHFPSIALHELVHLLGYGSKISTSGMFAGTGLNGTSPDVYSTFDSFLSTLGGTALIDPSAHTPTVMIGSEFSTLLTEGVKFAGPFAMEAALGDFVLSADLSHSVIPTDVMFPSFAAGEVRDELTAGDTGVLRDLGYAIDFDDADFDSDSDIDGADFLGWQLGFGKGAPGGIALLSDGDANHDGFVSFADLGAWFGQYGTPGAMLPVPFTSTSAESVPEPTSLIMLALGTLGLGVVRAGRMNC